MTIMAGSRRPSSMALAVSLLLLWAAEGFVPAFPSSATATRSNMRVSMSLEPPGGGKLKGLRGPGAAVDSRVVATSELKEWLGENGVWVWDKSDWGVAPHPLGVAVDTVDEYEGEKAGRGMVANREIKEGDELFSLPMDLLLTKARAQQVMGQNVITDDLSEYIAVALLLIRERNLGKESFWAPYINVLPTMEEVGPAFSWTDEQLDLLSGSPVVPAAMSMRKKLEMEYAELQDGLFASHPDMFPPSVYDFAAFSWAFTVLFSRAIRLGSLSTGEAIALVPYADLFNHNPFANSYIDARQTGLFTKKDEVAVYSDRSYKQMEQVFISYGPKSNADLLLLYGFALDRNPFNSVEVAVGLLEDDPLRAEKALFLKQSGQPEQMQVPLYNDRYPDELLQYLRLICIASHNLKGRALAEVDYSELIDEDNEREVFSSIRSACEVALEGYPTTEEQDSLLMNDEGMFRTLDRITRMAIKHRRQEKRILQRTIGAVSKELERLALPLRI
jgi:hypothetical protein